MAKSIGDRRELIAIWNGKTSYGADWRQQSKGRVQSASVFLTRKSDVKNDL
jgi:hypothetical protein